MKCLIIKKWIEPYRLLETVKLYCNFTDYTFDGMNKLTQKDKMFAEIQNNKINFALYMKNVNKFYVFSPNGDFDLLSKLIEVFEFKPDDYEINENPEGAISLVDMGKSEASFLNI